MSTTEFLKNKIDKFGDKGAKLLQKLALFGSLRMEKSTLSCIWFFKRVRIYESGCVDGFKS